MAVGGEGRPGINGEESSSDGQKNQREWDDMKKGGERGRRVEGIVGESRWEARFIQ